MRKMARNHKRAEKAQKTCIKEMLSSIYCIYLQFIFLHWYSGGEQTYVLWLRAHWAEDWAASPLWGHRHADVTLPLPGAPSEVLGPGQALAEHTGLPAADCDTLGARGLMSWVLVAEWTWLWAASEDVAQRNACGKRAEETQKGDWALISICTEGYPGFESLCTDLF